MDKQKKYDFIIAGGGCAGLSLLFAILNEPRLQQKSILVIDKDVKNQNDRTWCFWEKEDGPLENIVHHKWNNLLFKSKYFTSEIKINPYKYKMIKGIDFYNHVLAFATQFSNVHFVTSTIKSLQVENNIATLKATDATYTSTYIFNSTNLLYDLQQLMLLQHFMGWEIETSKPVFNESVATFMDFTVSQKHGTTFMYVLPTSPTTALVEYTLFTKNVLDKQAYETALKAYIQDELKLSSYNIVHQEFGIIPMTKQSFATHHQQKIINIGTAAGCVKASSGYTFSFVQKHTKAIVQKLVANETPIIKKSLWQKRFHLYDKTLLEVLLKNKMNGDEVFAQIFKGNKPQRVLAFLDNDSNFKEELQIMSSVPTFTFLPIAIKEMCR